ncbi:hypothetical protein CEUSTIGMA_g3667.t1 [Chlamydomonas eustigma]|uniref:Condensin complex subunit 1 C-terminal domain-containing protein n=1 Tax=Chlamydomonas eustigma TaxID=1157962 RepID=A0A250WZF2_9CHLO|nr:hypothetical protein CEUSTIGMA_g3667.t1 [Chlamydomonas eustigma]|eukprot:GAX76223.1 hypothetical protein CEUSTIGMA_g3667.t1 [Chlamydomonas eustigma]
MAKPPVRPDSFFTWNESIPKEEKEVPSAGKTEEELKAFTVDERISDVERTVLYLNGGHIIQQRQAISNLPSVIKGRGKSAWDAVSPALKAALNRLHADAQIDAADAFSTLCKERLMAPMELQTTLLSFICRNINKEKSEEETDAWLRSLFELIPWLDKESLKSEVLTLAMSKADVEESVMSRCICARILGPVAAHLSREEIEKTFFKKAMTMCQDVDFHVRITMCEQLQRIGNSMGSDIISGVMLNELLELLKDEDMKVRAAAFRALTLLLEKVNPDARKTKVLPVLRDHMHPFDLDTDMQSCIGSLFGTILMAVKNEMQIEDCPLFYGCFRHLAARSNDDLRVDCALQFSSSAKAANLAAASLGLPSSPSAYQIHFHDALLSMVSDSCAHVRLAVSEQLHEIMRLVPAKDVPTLFLRPLVKLIGDDSMAVPAALLPNLVTILTLLNAGIADEVLKEVVMADVAKALVGLDAACTSTNTWRPQRSLAECFPTFVQLFSQEQIAENLLPMAFRFLSSAASAVRPPAVEGMAAFLRKGLRERQQAETYLKLIRDFARGRTFSLRIAFVQVAHHMIVNSSSRFVKDWVFDLCLELLYDPIPNVRLQVIPLLPSLKQVVRLPEDVDLLERLNNAISNATTDNDRDVCAIARSINDTFKRMPVRMGVGSQSAILVHWEVLQRMKQTTSARKRRNLSALAFLQKKGKSCFARETLMTARGAITKRTNSSLDGIKLLGNGQAALPGKPNPHGSIPKIASSGSGAGLPLSSLGASASGGAFHGSLGASRGMPPPSSAPPSARRETLSAVHASVGRAVAAVAGSTSSAGKGMLPAPSGRPGALPPLTTTPSTRPAVPSVSGKSPASISAPTTSAFGKSAVALLGSPPSAVSKSGNSPLAFSEGRAVAASSPRLLGKRK